ncbi:MAG TPA: ABC transporter ATP-binding protein [Candidatus Lustribacter sp.]|jgi:NitT/TauT family transport system ATP-binding protein|nr:ABC transporter ATP-binding protein [Candidatus Lustribacter sp.]
MTEVAVVADGLSLTFGSGDERTAALDRIDLTIERGEFVSLIGPSGCGKTTLLRAIADLERPTSGTLLVNGMTPEAARRERAYGYVFQAPALYPWRNVERNVMLPLEIMGLPRAERLDRAQRNLQLVGLSDVARRFPWQLSGGMQQRVSIARALSFEPSLLLMDEPFGALDEITRDGLNLHLHELWRTTGMTTVFVTHSIPEAVYLSTRIVVMSPRPGRIVEVIDCDLGAERPLGIRDTPAFTAVGSRVRRALHGETPHA